MVYFAVGYNIVRGQNRTNTAVDVLSWVPAAVPGILMSLGLLWLYLGTPLRGFLYGTVGGLVVAVVIGHMATGVQQTKASLFQVNEELEQASRVCGAGPFRTKRAILFPLIGPPMAAVAILTVASAVRDISTVVLLSGQRSRPLSILMLEYSFTGDLERGAALGVLLTVIVSVFALVARRLGAMSVRADSSNQKG